MINTLMPIFDEK